MGIEADAHFQRLRSAVKGRSFNLLECHHDIRIQAVIAEERNRRLGLFVVLLQIEKLQRQHLVEMPPFRVLRQILNVVVVEVARNNVGPHIMLRIAPDVPGSGRQLVVAIVELQVVMDMVRHVACRGPRFQRQRSRQLRRKGVARKNLAADRRRQQEEQNCRQKLQHDLYGFPWTRQDSRPGRPARHAPLILSKIARRTLSFSVPGLQPMGESLPPRKWWKRRGSIPLHPTNRSGDRRQKPVSRLSRDCLSIETQGETP